MIKCLTAALAALIFMTAGVARAQVPSYAQPDTDEQVHGRIVSSDGGYNMTVRDSRGYIDDVELHEGTIINPTGITLEPGMVVSILGYNAGSYLAANEIDTPYTMYGAVPYYGGHSWSYYGPSVSLGFFFGNTGWWHGDYFRGGGPHVGHVYDGHPGGFQGRNFVAPPSHGGYHAAGFGHGGGGHGGGGHSGGGHGGSGHVHP